MFKPDLDSSLHCNLLTLLLGCLSLLLFAGLLFNAPSTVKAAGVVTDCSTYGPGAGTLQQALSGGGFIEFACSGAITLPATINISAPTEISAEGQSVELSGNNSLTIFRVNSGINFTIQNLTMRNGRGGAGPNGTGAYYGAAIYNDNGTVNVYNSTFYNNNPSFGTVYNWHGTLNLVHSSFLSNSGTEGGAIFNDNGAVTIDSTTFDFNQLLSGPYSMGGAIFNLGSLTISNSTFTNNTSEVDGGAIYNYGNGTLFITNSNFTRNSAADSGGAIFVYTQKEVNISNTTFYLNNASFSAGAYYQALSGSTHITNTTFMNNTIPPTGGPGTGAIDVDSGTINLSNSIIVRTYTTTENCRRTSKIVDGGNNLQWPDTSCGSTITWADPLVSNIIKDNGGPTMTNALLAGSPAIDNGNPANCPATDQRYYTRSGPCDIGAFERNGTAPSNLSLTKAFSSAMIVPGVTSTLTINVVNSNSNLPLNNISFNDIFPNGLTIAPAGITSNTCTSGSLKVNTDSTRFSIRGLHLDSSTSCLISVEVVATTAGEYTNAITTSFSSETSTRPANTQANLTVCNPTIVNTTQDNTSCGTLRSSLNLMLSYPSYPTRTVQLNLPSSSVINLGSTATSLTVPSGVSISSTCTPTGPAVTIDGSAITIPNTDGLILQGNSTITGLKLKGFNGKQVRTIKNNNHLKCVVASKF